MSDEDSDSDFDSTLDDKNDSADEGDSVIQMEQNVLSQSQSCGFSDMQLHSRPGRAAFHDTSATDFAQICSTPNYFSIPISSQLSPPTLNSVPPTKRRTSTQQSQTKVITQTLAGGKRVHMLIKDDPDVAHAQDEEFYLIAKQAVAGSHVSHKSREDVNAAIEAMKCAKETWKNKRLEGEGETASFLKKQRPKENDESVQIAQCNSLRRRSVLVSSKAQHEQFIACVARDLAVKNNIAMAFSEKFELVPRKFGAALHVQLKYRSTFSLPTDDDIDEHIMIAHALMKDCYPKEIHALVVLCSDIYMKLAEELQTTSEPLLCKTVHLIWPAIVVYDIRQLIVFWKTLDCRISNVCPLYSNIVEFQTIGKNCLRMRMMGNYKVIRCIYCRSADSNQASKYTGYPDSCSDLSDNDQQEDRYMPSFSPPSQRNSFSQNTASSLLQSLSQNSLSSQNSKSTTSSRSDYGINTCVHCSKGRMVVPNGVLNMYAVLEGNVLNKELHQSMSLEDQLGYSLIARPCFEDDEDWSKNREAEFILPKDAPAPDDRSPAVSGCPNAILLENKKQQDQFGLSCDFVLYASELRAMKAMCKSKSHEKLSPAMRPELFVLCNKVVQSTHEKYAHVVATQITIAHSKKIIYVNVKGKNQRFCFLHGREHEEDRIFFTIIPKSCMVRVQCYNANCKKILSLEMAHIAYKCQMTRRKRDGAAGGHGANVPRPRESLTEENILALELMKADISVESGWREQLYEALGQTYMGKKKRAPKIQHLGPLQCKQPSDLTDNVVEPEEEVMDKSLMIKVPRSLIHESWQNKIDYLNSRSKNNEDDKPLDLLCPAQNIAKVTNIPLPVRSQSRPTLEERKRILQDLVQKSKSTGSRISAASLSQP